MNEQIMEEEEEARYEGVAEVNLGGTQRYRLTQRPYSARDVVALR